MDTLFPCPQKNVVKRVLPFLLLAMALPIYAHKSVQYYFKSLDVDDGLSQNTVCQILQDRKGFMWFGTKEGLNRYDGASFHVYKKENSDVFLGIFLLNNYAWVIG